ncbi:GNAT family N-acetyltransferase [Micromonospora endolithica]|uniref:GNAT family N-acetyltransferase n=1 Tax=Micromonospora endolithica TaxID=230091 RepID=A0A3A9YRY7_9ACTN|nr:GNAT family N-acetyltransferase [Micromonospora endolithica]RKN38077.1 GNAT family N-acetyltransferase [Micromonospora endolithica]TWJ23852.1 RimJ/RimL family protein N-acetyltransferase [Micromonospora endolithica]
MSMEIIETHGVRLRPYLITDAADAAAGCDDPLTSRFLPGLPSPYTEADARWWITEGAPAVWAGGGAAYAIADPDTDRLLGGAGLSQVVPFRSQAEVGYWVAPWARGRGVATAATRALAGHAFATGTARLELLTHPENTASQRVALAAGFRHEGVRRAAGPTRTGERADLIAWVRLADDPPGPARRVLPDLPDGRLTDGVVTLRPLRGDDAGTMFRLHTRPEVVANQPPPVPPTREAITRRCALSGSAWLTGSIARLLILDTATGEPAGSCGLSVTEPAAFGEGMVGYALLPDWRGRGYATRALRLLAGWAFGPVGMARLVAGTLPGNVASHRVLENVGFRREGLLTGRLPGLDGTRTDDLAFGLVPGELR